MPKFRQYLWGLQFYGRLGERYLYRLFQRVWVRRWIRFGHGAKGFLYGLIGLFALREAIFEDQPVGGSNIVLGTLDDRAFGTVVLAFLAVALAGYAFWRLIQMLIDPEHLATQLSAQQILQRCGYGFSGLSYLGIGYTAGRLAIGLTVDFDDTAEEVAEALFEVAIGPWALLASGIGVILVGLVYIYGAYSGKFISAFQPSMYLAVKRVTVFLGKLGFTTRGVSFILIGSYLMKAAYFLDDETAGGLGQVLGRLDDQPFGNVWLAAIAFGFLAYATYMIMAAIYRRFPSA